MWVIAVEQLYLRTSTKCSIKASTVQNFLFISCQRFSIKDVNDFVSYLFRHHLPKKKMIFSFSSSSCLVNFAGGPYKMSTLFRRVYYKSEHSRAVHSLAEARFFHSGLRTFDPTFASLTLGHLPHLQLQRKSRTLWSAKLQTSNHDIIHSQKLLLLQVGV